MPTYVTGYAMVTLRDVTADASISDAFRHALQRHMANFPAPCAPGWATVVARIERVAERRRGLGPSLVTEHSLVPGLTRQLIGLLACFCRPLRRCPDRTAVDRLSRFGAHGGRECAPVVGIGKPLQLAARRWNRRQARRWYFRPAKAPSFNARSASWANGLLPTLGVDFFIQTRLTMPYGGLF
jgi:hypothetical protein